MFVFTKRVFTESASNESFRGGSRRALVVAAVFFALAVSAWSIVRVRTLPNPAITNPNDDQLDQRLQQAATLALGDRRGAIIVMDPQTGRVQAVVNSELAFRQSFPPGSTIKPFTALAALRAGLIDEDERTLCHEKYFHGQFHTTCSHPLDLPPLNPTEAIAYSCNYYFGKLGERLPETELNSTLKNFGFGQRTEVGSSQESQGKMQRIAWRPQSAMGEGQYLQTTPLQLISAYAALVNGGHVFTPRFSPIQNGTPNTQPGITINNEQREIIVKGMRGAVRYGTAESANLYSLPLYVFGKTGSATEINGYRTHGWFVGFAAHPNDDGNDASVPAAEKVGLAVLVFLAKAHGVEAAALARPIFAEFAKTEQPNSGATNSTQPLVAAAPNSANEHHSSSAVQVFLVGENAVRTMPVEDYVRGVVATEGSTEQEKEALKALAIASRTFIYKNMGRHRTDGYDFCNSTHCQRYEPPNENQADVPARVKQAVAQTNGEVLQDTENRIVDSYFSASCGGETANIATLWGGNAPSYLRGVDDEYCESQAHHSWTDKIPEAKLLKALQSDPRTNVGARLTNIAISRRDDTGRAQSISIEGERRLTLSGWDFKIIVGRALGWNLLKSSRFEISRAGTDYIFRGGGFGHGLGLCQEGAHVMAARGANYRQILQKYFPTTHVATERRLEADLLWGAPEIGIASKTSSIARLTISSEGFRINYPSIVTRREAEELLTLLQAARQSLTSRISAAGLSLQFPALEIFVNDSTGNFVGRTGQPPWAAAATRDRRIELQPLATLKRKRILDTTLRHELAHAAIDVVGRGRAPRWLAEGLAIYLAGEGKFVERYAPRAPIKTDELEHKLASAKSSPEMRAAYAAAYLEVKRLIQNDGEAKVWRRVAQ